MKKYVLLPLLLLFVISCGNSNTKAIDSKELAAAIKENFSAISVNVIAESNSLDVDIEKSSIAAKLKFDEQRTATAAAVFAKNSLAGSITKVNVNIKGDSVKDEFEFNEKELNNYAKSTQAAESYLNALLKKDKEELLSLGDNKYLGESILPQIYMMADEVKALGSEKSRKLVGVMDSNIDNTTIPVHIVNYYVEYSGGKTRVCTFFVHSETDHKVAGFDIR